MLSKHVPHTDVPSQCRTVCLWFRTTSHLPAKKSREEVLASYLVDLVYTWELPDKLIWQENHWGLDLQGTKADAWACLKEGTLLPERCPQGCVQDIQSWRKFDSSARQSQKITCCWEDSQPSQGETLKRAMVWSFSLQQICMPLGPQKQDYDLHGHLCSTLTQLDPQPGTFFSSLGT